MPSYHWTGRVLFVSWNQDLCFFCLDLQWLCSLIPYIRLKDLPLFKVLKDMPLNWSSLEGAEVPLPPSMTIEQNNNFLSMLIAGEQQPLWERSSKSAKLFRCDVCGKRFTSDFAKRRHEKNLHSTIDHRPRPYSCKYCNLKFIEKHHMKMHVVRVHSNVGWD